MKKITLFVLWVSVTIHFLKDITQDILQINSPLDAFGNITENLAWLPTWGQNVYLYFFGGLSVVAEAILIYCIPFTLFNRSTAVKSKLIKYCLIYLGVFFVIALSLDAK